MDLQLYKQLFRKTPSGCAIFRKVAAGGEMQNEFELVDGNHIFEYLIGFSKSDMAGLLSGGLPAGNLIDPVWINMLSETVNLGQSAAEVYSEIMHRWFRADAYLLQEDYYALQLHDITDYKTRILEAERESRLFQNAINGADVGIWEWNVQTGEQVINERWAAIVGYTLDELAPVNIETWRSLTHPEDLAAAEKKIKKVFWKDRKHYTLTFRMKHKDGRWIWIESNGIVTSWTSERKPLIVSGSHVDITKRKLAEDALKENERRLTTSQEIAHIGNWELNLETKEMWGSEEAFKIYGIERKSSRLPLAEAQAKVLAEYRQMMDDALTGLIARDKRYDVEYKIINGFTNKEIFVHSRAILQKDKYGRPVKVVGTIQDKTEEMKRQNELIHLSYHDQLTGLYNRRFFNEELSRLDTAGNLPITIVLCDVNGLKLVNDSFGHDLGDELLKKVAKILRSGCRSGDITSRYGGDEFAMILPNTTKQEAEALIKRIKKRIAKEKVGAFDVSVSFGFETQYREGEDIRTISKNAEDHMYTHKLYESKSARSKTVDLIINTLYEKNNREMLHSKRVSALCEAFANYINLGKDEVNKIRIAGLMHDIGKIGIDDKILNKKEPLTGSEWEEVKRHSEIGYRILGAVNEFSEVAEFVLEHQERWDGTGYPKGLKGEGISLEARMIAISDSYDAMTGVRTYGRVLPKEEALNEIERCAGSQFDPYLARLFVEMQLQGTVFP